MKTNLLKTFLLVSTLSFADSIDPFFDDMLKMQQQMDKMFETMQQSMMNHMGHIGGMSQMASAAGSGFEKKDRHYELVTDIPESANNEISIKTEGQQLILSAKVVQKQSSNQSGYYRSSSSMQFVQRSFLLPDDLDIDTLSTEYREGRLVITAKVDSSTVSNATNNTVKKIKLSNDGSTI